MGLQSSPVARRKSLACLRSSPCGHSRVWRTPFTDKAVLGKISILVFIRKMRRPSSTDRRRRHNLIYSFQIISPMPGWVLPDPVNERVEVSGRCPETTDSVLSSGNTLFYNRMIIIGDYRQSLPDSPPNLCDALQFTAKKNKFLRNPFYTDETTGPVNRARSNKFYRLNSRICLN